MSVHSYRPSTPSSYASHHPKLVHISQADATSVAARAVYAPPPGQQVPALVPQEQSRVAIPLYSKQAMPTKSSSSQSFQGAEQNSQQMLPGQFLEVVQSPMRNQSQGLYNEVHAHPVLVSSVSASQPAFPTQCAPVQTTQPQLYLTQPGVFPYEQRLYRSPQFCQTQTLPNQLAGHEPCIQTLTFLESQIERQKLIEKNQSEQLRIMWEKSNEQEKKLEQLKVECRLKDLRIGYLKSRMDPKNIIETQKAEVPRLRAVIKEQRDELERLQNAPGGSDTDDTVKGRRFGNGPGGLDTDDTVKGKRCERRSNKSRYVPSRQNSYNTSSTPTTVDYHPDELGKLREENEAFRLVIGRLERENSEISRLRVEVLQLGQRLREMKPLQKKIHQSDYHSVAG